MMHYIALRTTAQATEDPAKVRSALELFLTPQDRETDETSIIRETTATGYHGNPIIVMEAEVEKKKDCRYIIDYIRHTLGAAGIERLISELPRRVDEDCNLFLRFDKQEAYQGRLVITGTSDAVHIRMKIKVYPARREDALEAAREMFKMED
ncbi:MAG: RNA-binding domain-containing protein [ANME-2 cluster archaeon]|nr:RNA-binding domain-containing protein [ANME-2 cluster archaeon]